MSEQKGTARVQFGAKRNAAVEHKAFWNSKILDWEATRYGTGASPDLVERIAGRISSSVRSRLETAVQLLASYLPGRRVVEIGCGSGLLADRLLELGAASYQGYDISDAAIVRAKQRASESPRGAVMHFSVAGVADLHPQDDALVVSLGLIDWLAPTEMDYLFALSSHGPFFHGLSEQRWSVTQLIHRAYVHFSYGRKTGGYMPQYHQVTEIAAIARRHQINQLNIYRRRKLRFGIFVSNLPIN